jgi:hypothetical protein
MQIELRGRVVLSRAETVLQGTRHDTVRAEIGYGEKVSQRLCLKKLDGGSIGRPGAAVRGARKDAECSSWREWFHAAALICGGERSWISAAESLSRKGKPLGQSNILRRSLHPVLEKLGIQRCGFHAFRRFRNTYLRNYTSCPNGLRNFWLG